MQYSWGDEVKITRFYNYLFYKIYSFLKDLPLAEYYVPDFNASVIMALLLIANITTALMLLELFFGIRVLLPHDRIGSILTYGTIVFLHYIIFNYKKKYLKIVHYYDEKKCDSKKRWIILIYIFGTPIIVIILSALINP